MKILTDSCIAHELLKICKMLFIFGAVYTPYYNYSYTTTQLYMRTEFQKLTISTSSIPNTDIIYYYMYNTYASALVRISFPWWDFIHQAFIYLFLIYYSTLEGYDKQNKPIHRSFVDGSLHFVN